MIKCAAIKVGKLVYSMTQPARHHDIIYAVWAADGGHVRADAIEGFLTEAGDFIDREAAFKLTGKGRHGKTYSEDLW